MVHLCLYAESEDAETVASWGNRQAFTPGFLNQTEVPYKRTIISCTGEMCD